jgi:hypothetical protein
MPRRIYPVAQVIDIHDGDTIRLLIDLGFDELHRVWIRLLDVRAPEENQEGAEKATRDVWSWMATNSPDFYVMVETLQTAGTIKEIREKTTFLRYVGVVRAHPGGETLNDFLRAQGWIDKGN